MSSTRGAALRGRWPVRRGSGSTSRWRRRPKARSDVEAQHRRMVERAGVDPGTTASLVWYDNAPSLDQERWGRCDGAAAPLEPRLPDAGGRSLRPGMPRTEEKAAAPGSPSVPPCSGRSRTSGRDGRMAPQGANKRIARKTRSRTDSTSDRRANGEQITRLVLGCLGLG
jgi:hypothetical protein